MEVSVKLSSVNLLTTCHTFFLLSSVSMPKLHRLNDIFARLDLNIDVQVMCSRFHGISLCRTIARPCGYPSVH